MLRLLLMCLAGIYSCSAAVIPSRDESILLNAILNAASNKSARPKSLERVTWTKLKPIFLQGVQKESRENAGGKHTSNQVAAVLQNSLRSDKDESFGGKENSKTVISPQSLIETDISKNEHRNNSVNDSINIPENEKDIVHKDMDIAKASVISNDSFFEDLETLEMNERKNPNIFALNFTDYATDFQAFSEDLDTIESLSFDENNLLSEGSEIALFQELPTTGFEFLIDSETTKNLILTQLLASQSLLMDEFAELQESMAFDPVPTELNLDETDIEVNITPTQEISNLTKGLDTLPEATEGEDNTFSLNVTDDDKSGRFTNVEFTDLLQHPSFSNSETMPASLDGNTEAESNRTLQVKASINDLKDLETLPEGLESKNFISNKSDFEYDGPIQSNIDLSNFFEEVSFPQTPLFNTKNGDLDITAQEIEALNLVNNSQGSFGKENVENEIFNLNTTTISGNVIKSNTYADLNESLGFIPITRRISVDENGNEEFDIKAPIQESFKGINSNILLGLEEKETEKLQSSITDFDYDWSKTELTDFEETLNYSLETHQVAHSLDENEKTKLNTTLVQEIFSPIYSDTLAEETKTKFLSNSSNYANESTEIGELLGLWEESQDFIPDNQSFKLDKNDETALNMVVSFEETLNAKSNSEVFDDTEVTESFKLNTTDISNTITEFDEFTKFEEYTADTTENHSFDLDGNGDSELNVTPNLHTFDTRKDLEQNDMEMENLSLNVTDFVHDKTTQPVKDDMAKPQSCPASGFCLLWFFAQDSCTEDSQCHSTQKCCKSGCSKTCVDI